MLKAYKAYSWPYKLFCRLEQVALWCNDCFGQEMWMSYVIYNKDMIIIRVMVGYQSWVISHGEESESCEVMNHGRLSVMVNNLNHVK